MSFSISHTIPGMLSVVLAVTWLNPFAPGPSPIIMPWLVSLVCAAIAAWIVSRLPLQNLPGLAAKTWLLAALLSASLALLQYFGLSYSLSPWINTTGVGEAFGNLRQRNQFASLTNIGLLCLFWWLVHDGDMFAARHSRTDSVLLVKPQGNFPHWTIACSVLLEIGNAASSSRTGLMQLLLIVLLVGWWSRLRQRSTRRLVQASVFAYVVASISLPLLIGMELGAGGILGRANEHAPSCASRITLWTNVLHLIAQKPWFGWGWGELDFAHFITLYPGARFCDILDNAHNLPLHLAVELGIPAALLICGCGLWLVWRAHPWRERDPTRQMAWGVLAMILLHSMLEYPLWYGPFQMASGICILLLWTIPVRLSANSVEEAAPGTENALFSPFGLTVIRYSAIVIIAAAAYAAWDYHRISQIYLAPAQRDEAYRSNTLAKIKNSWLFQNQVRFAELTTTALNAENAAHLNAMAHELLHFSPEALVVEKLIDSAALLGRTEEIEFFKRRYQAAFADQYDRWARKHGQP